MWSWPPGGCRDARASEGSTESRPSSQAWSVPLRGAPPLAESAGNVSGSRAVWLTRRSTSRDVLERIALGRPARNNANRSIDMRCQREVARIRRGRARGLPGCGSITRARWSSARRTRSMRSRRALLALSAQRESASLAIGSGCAPRQPRVRHRSRVFAVERGAIRRVGQSCV